MNINSKNTYIYTYTLVSALGVLGYVYFLSVPQLENP